MKTFFIITLIIFLASCDSGVNIGTENETVDVMRNKIQEVMTHDHDDDDHDDDDHDDHDDDDHDDHHDHDDHDDDDHDHDDHHDDDDHDDDILIFPPEQSAVIDSIVNDIEEGKASIEIDELPVQESVTEDISISEPRFQTFQKTTSYNNPAGKVDMNIEYTLSPEGIIESISVTSPNYRGMPDFNQKVQAVIGMAQEQASEYYVSGSSLTTPAFQNAMKNS